MAHLFLSHATRDAASAAALLVEALEKIGHRCWLAPRDVRPGVPYPGQIVTAIEQGVGLILLLSPAANESLDVLQEVQLASAARKPIAPVHIGTTVPSSDLRYYVGVRHRIAWSQPNLVAVELVRTFGVPPATGLNGPAATSGSVQSAVELASAKGVTASSKVALQTDRKPQKANASINYQAELDKMRLELLRSAVPGKDLNQLEKAALRWFERLSPDQQREFRSRKMSSDTD